MTERQSYILRVRNLAKACGEAFLLTEAGGAGGHSIGAKTRIEVTASSHRCPILLLELRSEEIPARMQRKAAGDLRKMVTDGLVEAGPDL